MALATLAPTPRDDDDDHDPPRHDEFWVLWQAHSTQAYQRALALASGDVGIAEDAFQDAWESVYKQWLKGRVEHFGAYLGRAVENKTYDIFRKQKRQRREEEKKRGDDRGHGLVADHVADRSTFRWALAQLPERVRTVLVLYYFEDRSVPEIAAHMDTAEGTVKSQLSRGREKLRRMLEDGE